MDVRLLHDRGSGLSRMHDRAVQLLPLRDGMFVHYDANTEQWVFNRDPASTKDERLAVMHLFSEEMAVDVGLECASAAIGPVSAHYAGALSFEVLHELSVNARSAMAGFPEGLQQ